MTAIESTLLARFCIAFPDFNLDLDLALPYSGVTAFFGPSGCGKTTLLRCIAGLMRAPIGYLRVNGEVWQDANRFLPTHRRTLGYVFQEPSLFPHLSVRGNLEYGQRRVATPDRRIAIADIVDVLGIGPLLHRFPLALSGGERQRVAIARALAVSPRLLLMDEPLAALDRPRRQEILPYLERLRDHWNLPILYVTHDIEEVARLADHLVLLHAGQLQAVGPTQELLTRLDLPLAQEEQAAAVLAGYLVNHDEVYHLSQIAVPGGTLLLPRENVTVGQPVKVRIHARDVSIALTAHTDSSILNRLPVVIADIQYLDPVQALVRLVLKDGQMLLARITRRSATTLELQPGLCAFAQIKSAALLD